MKEFVAYLVKNLVDQPDTVDVSVVEDEQSIFIEIRVSPEDVGKVVGRRGRTINALRTITSMIGARMGRRVRVEVIQ